MEKSTVFLLYTKQKYRGNAEAHADPLANGELFAEKDYRANGGKDQSTSVDDGEEDRAVHLSRKIEIKHIVYRAAYTGNRRYKDREQSQKRETLFAAVFALWLFSERYEAHNR